MPESGPSREEIERALADIQQWPALARSPQLARFLDYIVHAKLRGEEASIKAYSIAVDVLGRPSTFDPQSDPIVRVQAGRLRAALDEFYRSEAPGSPVRIYLPVGRYVPEFGLQKGIVPDAVAATASPEGPPAGDDLVTARLQRRRNPAILAGALAVVALAVVALSFVLNPGPASTGVPQVPVVAISEFTGLAGEDGTVPSLAGLAVELVTDLRQFDDLSPVYAQGNPDGALPGAAAGYQLTGIARKNGNEIQVTASLRRANSDSALWSETVAVPIDTPEISVDAISQAFADQIGSHRGPLHADAVNWLEANPDISGRETEYLCGLLFELYRDSAKATDAARARSCLSEFLRREAGSARALAMRGALLLDETIAMQPPGRLDPEPVAEARRLVERAVAGAPTSSLVWELYAGFLEAAGRAGEAAGGYSSALQLNPANLDAAAGYGRLLSLQGSSPRGEAVAESAIEREVRPPHWYFAAPAINALRGRKDKAALGAAEHLAAGDAELASVVATVAAYRSGSEQILNRYLAQLLDVTRFRRFGILPVLRQRIPDADLVGEIAEQLAAAGVSPAALSGPF